MRPDGLVAGASYVDRGGNEHEVRAGVTILAANGVGTPRLLQLSGDSPDGLANSSGLVGKRLMMHPFGTVVGVFDEDLRACRARGASTSTRSSSTRPTSPAASSAAPSGGCSRPAGRSR